METQTVHTTHLQGPRAGRRCVETRIVHTTHLQGPRAGRRCVETRTVHTTHLQEQVAGVWKHEQYIQHTYKAREVYGNTNSTYDTPTRPESRSPVCGNTSHTGMI